MLTAVASTTAVHIDISSMVVRLAVTYVTGEHGWTRCTHHQSTSCACVRITDNTSAGDHRVDIRVAKDTPAACQAALDAVLHGRARSVVLWDEPETIPSTIESLRAGSVVVPSRLIDLALEAPRLTTRQRQTVRLVALGRTNGEIAAQLHQSISTTKRDVVELLEAFDVTTRTGLPAAAARLGFL